MEIESSDGSRTLVKMGSVFEFGRGSGFEIDDRTVSRRHVSFRVKPSDESSSSRARAEFKVLGMNPIWIRRCRSRHEISTFRASEGGEIEIGDMFCVSAKNPIWFTLKKTDLEAETENTMNSDPQPVDISDIDPVKEFGFLVIGKEFDGYPKKMIRDIRNWNWFIEDPIVVDNEEDDDDENKRKIAVKRKRKNRKEEEEEEEVEWTGESEEENVKEQLTNKRKFERPNKYLTRSKDMMAKKSGNPLHKKNTLSNVKRVVVGKKEDEYEDEDEDEEEDEEDETLGGFIVNDNVKDEEDEEKQNADEEEEEKEEDDEEEENYDD